MSTPAKGQRASKRAEEAREKYREAVEARDREIMLLRDTGVTWPVIMELTGLSRRNLTRIQEESQAGQ